ncbi:MAG: CoA ester lyase [Syntrophobacteraceae bacterium]
MERPFRLRRSVLSVPANREKMLRKASRLSADVIMLDLEDSVPLPEKDFAREAAIVALREIDWQGKVRAVRINGVDAPFAYKDLIDVVEGAGQYLDVLVIPKVSDACEIRALDIFLTQIEARMGYPHRIGLEASIETALGMLKVGEIAFASPRLEALVFGVADYTASLEMKSKGISGHGDAELDYPGDRYHFPLSRMVMAAKAAGLAAVDAPFGDFKNPDGLKDSCIKSVALGYDGKWAIHPDQLQCINEVYSPSSEDYARSQRILAAYRDARRVGRGSVALDGKMVDAASIRIATVICSQWEAIHAGVKDDQGSSLGGGERT